MRSRCLGALLGAAILLTVGSSVEENQVHAQSQSAAFSDVKILPVQGSIFLIAGAGANITVQVGKEGVLLVDAGSSRSADKVLTAVEKILRERNGSPARGRLEEKIRFIIDTTADADHAGGNELLSKAGLGYVTNDPANRLAGLGNDPAVLVSHENVVKRLLAPLGGGSPSSMAAVPQSIYTGAGESRKDFFFDEDGIQVIHAPAAHSDGDSLVYFRKNDVVSAGDVYVTTAYPVIDLERGGSLQGLIGGLNRILDLAIAGHNEEDGTIIVPGHGRLADEADVAEYRDMITIIRDRMAAAIRGGATLEQIKAARLTRDYDPQYGSGGPGGANTDQFVEIAYRSLTQKK